MAKIAVLLTEGFADWEYALIGGTGGPYFGLDVQYFAPDAGDLRSMGGLTAAVPKDLNDLSQWQPDVLVVVGGTVWETDQAPDVDAVLTAQRERGAVIAGICGGTLALARAGLLNDTPHTSNDAEYLTQNAEGYAGSPQYRTSASAISSERIITAPGTAPVSFTAAVLEAAGVPADNLAQFTGMLGAEHAA